MYGKGQIPIDTLKDYLWFGLYLDQVVESNLIVSGI